MVYKLVRNRRNVTASLRSEDDVQELVQKCMIHLWEKSLPKYKQGSNAKVSTFLYRCAKNYISQEVRSTVRKKMAGKSIVIEHDLVMSSLKSKPHYGDKVLDHAAAHIVHNPRKVLTQVQCRVFWAMIDNPDMLRKDLATLLGYKLHSSFSTMIRRIKERIEDAGFDPDAYSK